MSDIPSSSYHIAPFFGEDYRALESLICEKYGAEWYEIAGYMNQAGYDAGRIDDLCRFAGVEREYNAAGRVVGYKIPSTVQNTIGSTVNSNTSMIHRANVRGVVSTGVSNTGKVTASRLAGIGSKVATAAGKVAVPLTVASVAVTLGKTIDEALYAVNPDYWNSIGMSTVNPQTWADIIIPDNELGQDVFNFLFGIDPQTGEAQAYLDADAFAYCAYCMQQAGIFATGSESIIDPSVSGVTLNTPIYRQSIGSATNHITNQSGTWHYYATNPYVYYNDGAKCRAFATKDVSGAFTDVKIGLVRVPEDNTTVTLVAASATDPWYQIWDIDINTETGYMEGGSASGASTYTYDNKTVYFRTFNTSNSSYQFAVNESAGQPNLTDRVKQFAYSLVYGEYQGGTSIPGIGNQDGATLPNFEGLSQDDYLPYLQQTYPDMFNNAIQYPVLQDDGTVDTHTYLPISLAESLSWKDLNPVSGDSTQASPEIDPSTSTQTLIDILTKVLQETQTKVDPDGYPTPPTTPTETGSGSSTAPIAPTGSASSLWKIYHPTQGQIDSFGAWLWSSNFIDQILKIFNNPMEAVIGLHKVYATPIDAGTATIKVGYLDSSVPSSYIEQQYIDVSCGTVNLNEQFGNVFDYSPFTDVQLYLPFVGIVPLNVADVMRSSISVNYGVDVITGACLAMVEVSRDGSSSVLYQYSGNCAVQYPVSSGSYMGIVTSIISVAGGVAATAASGGAAAPLALGAAGGLLGAHTSVQHSGGFSGNSGAMGGKTPYLIITRPQTKVAANAESMQGYGANEYTTIGECSGYIKADSVHVINVNATESELTEINELILSGIII